MRRTWVDAADVVLGLALLLVAVRAGSEGRVPGALAALVLGLAWGARGVAGLHRRAAPPLPAGDPLGPLPRTR